MAKEFGPYGTFHHSSYSRYTQSEWWKERRRQYVNTVGYRCETCSEDEGLFCHHVRYVQDGQGEDGLSVFFRERDEDLLMLCKSHHWEAHHGKQDEQDDEGDW